jgi:uncharacterized lipoprotein YajG
VARLTGYLTFIVALAIVLTGCGDRTVRVSLVYTPPHAPAAVPGAEAIALDVVNQDKRLQARDRIGLVREGRAIAMDGDPSSLVRGAVEQELKNQGFVVAPGGLVLTVELQNFYCDYGIASNASIAFTLRVREASGRTLYSHFYEGGANAGTMFAFDMKAAIKDLVERALSQAVELVASDKSLQRALLGSKAAARS